MPVDVVSYLYAATVAAGGIIGYVKAGKKFCKCTLIVQFWFGETCRRNAIAGLERARRNCFPKPSIAEIN